MAENETDPSRLCRMMSNGNIHFKMVTKLTTKMLKLVLKMMSSGMPLT